MADIEKVIDKVRKLLALAGSANEHEAAVAAEKAHALLAEHNLSLSDMESVADGDDEIRDDGEVETQAKPWVRVIAGGLGQLYFCKYYAEPIKVPVIKRNGKKGYVSKDRHHFVGAPHNTAVAVMMLEYLQKTVDRLAQEGSRSIPKAEQSPYRVSFRHAAAERLRHRLEERYREARRGTAMASDGRNLPVLANMYDNAMEQALDHLKSKGIHLRMSHRSSFDKHHRGVNDGRAAGDRIGLDGQISGRGSKHLLGKG